MAMLTAENRTREWEGSLLSWCCGDQGGSGSQLSAGMSRDQSSEWTEWPTGVTAVIVRLWESILRGVTSKPVFSSKVLRT